MGLKLGASDVAALRLGTSPVSKLMLGTTQLWPPAAPAGPTMLDTFTALAPTTNTTTKPFTVPAGKTIPAGVLLACAVALNGIMATGLSMTDNADDAGAANTYTRRSTDAWVQATNVSGFLYLAKTTREIDAGEVITFGHTGASRNRGALVAAWFSGVFPDTANTGDTPFGSGSSTAWSTGNQATPAAAPSLDLAVCVGTGAAPPFGYSGGYTKAGEAITAAGSADRSVALGYRISPAAGTRAAAGTCTDAVWGAGLVALDYTP